MADASLLTISRTALDVFRPQQLEILRLEEARLQSDYQKIQSSMIKRKRHTLDHVSK